jgi:very-short-patch-repair endonuclease
MWKEFAMATFPGYWHRKSSTWDKMKPEARRLRREQTPAEKALWARLRGGRLGGFKFRRQHPVAHFFPDFCCPAVRLIVEVDGPIHAATDGRDENRQRLLEAWGYRFLRVTNAEVLNDMESVLARITAALQSEP